MDEASLSYCPELNKCSLFRILQITHQLSTNIALDDALKIVVKAAEDVLSADRATVFLYDAQADELYSRVSTGEEEIRFSAKLGIAGETARTRLVINVADCYSDRRFNREIDLKTGYTTRCLLSLPLIGINNELVGVLEVLNKGGGVFDNGDEQLGRILAAQCAVALQRAGLIEEYLRKQKMERDLALARDIQMEVLPKELPSLPGYDIACWSRAAEETDGDIYDAVSLGDSKTAILVGDATGHGIGSALSVTQMRAMVRLGLRMEADLGTIVSQVNAQLQQDLPTNRFVTAFLGIVDSIGHQLRYYACGQGPLLHFHARDREVEWLDASSLPLGIMAGMAIPEPTPMRLEPGDIVGVISDGFFEYHDSTGRQFGMDRMADVIALNSSKRMADLIEGILAAIRSFAPTEPQRDDMTAVLVCRRS